MPPSSEPTPRDHDAGSQPLWQFVAMRDYQPPPADVVETTKRRIGTWWRRLQPDVQEPTPYVKPEAELDRLAQWQLRRAAPSPEWSDAAEALDAALGDWVTHPGGDQPLRLLVAPPHIRRGAILGAWAERRGWHIIPAPSVDCILSEDEAWSSQHWSDGDPWVLTNLERVYVRHARGLDLVCSFLDRARVGTLGPGLIGCDSWAWAYLGHVWRGWLPAPLTLQAYDEVRLARCFRRLAGQPGAQQVRFRQSDDGSDVLPPLEEATGEHSSSDFLHHLATYSRGNLGVAWAVWRAALRSEPLPNLAGEAERDQHIAGRTIWVTPWARMEHPAIPPGAGRDTAFVLHALLLHAGLTTALVRTLMPMTGSRVTEILDDLRVGGVISLYEDRWRVTPTGYPPAREFLEAKGYLTDAF